MMSAGCLRRAAHLVFVALALGPGCASDGGRGGPAGPGGGGTEGEGEPLGGSGGSGGSGAVDAKPPAPGRLDAALDTALAAEVGPGPDDGGSSGTLDGQSPRDMAAAPLPGDSTPPAGWTMKWSGTGSGAGLGMFEGQETAECTHAGATHASVIDGNVRIDMHYPADTDCKAGDRQRNEVKGMSAPGGGYISMKKGETWLSTYKMFIPDTLDATSGFTHIHQIFGVVGTMATVGPVVTMSLHAHEGTDSIEMRIDGTSGAHWSPTPLAPIQNKWVTVEFEVKWDTGGTFRWTIKDETQVYVNATRTWNGWHGGERMRPKWGIYRKRDSAGLQNTYILLNDFKAYQK